MVKKIAIIFLIVLFSSKSIVPSDFAFKSFQADNNIVQKKRIMKEYIPNRSKNPDYMINIQEEIELGEKELLAQLIEAEAGNQDKHGKALVADVVLNRVDSDLFPNSIEEVIYQKGQFGVMTDGAFDKAGYNISQESFQVAAEEYDKEVRINETILYFNNTPHRKNMWKYGDHWFK